MERVSQRKDGVVEQDLVLVDTAHNVHHDVRLHLVQHDSVVVKDDVAGLLGRLLKEALLESLLGLDIGVGVGGCARGSWEAVVSGVAPKGPDGLQELRYLPLGAV